MAGRGERPDRMIRAGRSSRRLCCEPGWGSVCGAGCVRVPRDGSALDGRAGAEAGPRVTGGRAGRRESDQLRSFAPCVDSEAEDIGGLRTVEGTRWSHELLLAS